MVVAQNDTNTIGSRNLLYLADSPCSSKNQLEGGSPQQSSKCHHGSFYRCFPALHEQDMDNAFALGIYLVYCPKMHCSTEPRNSAEVLYFPVLSQASLSEPLVPQHSAAKSMCLEEKGSSLSTAAQPCEFQTFSRKKRDDIRNKSSSLFRSYYDM